MIKNWLGWLHRSVELGLLVLLSVTALGFWLFAALLDEVAEGDTRGFDEWVLLSLRVPGDPAQPLGPPALQELMRDFTALGGVGVLTVITLIVIGFMVFERHYRNAVFLAVSVGSGIVASSMFKMLVARPRPDLVPHGSFVSTSSFPSGHSMMSAVVYLTLAIVIARHQTRAAVKAYVIAVAVALSGAVGLSRVYLGVHWPTDVLAGWALGGAWAIGCWGILEWRDRRTPGAPRDA